MNKECCNDKNIANYWDNCEFFLQTKVRYFCQYKYSTATVSPKYKMVGTTKQASKPSQTIAEINTHVEHELTIIIKQF